MFSDPGSTGKMAGLNLRFFWGRVYHMRSSLLKGLWIPEIQSKISLFLGLSLIIYTQDREYMRGLTVGKGVKVKLHAFDTMPILEDAFSVPPGFETFIGMKMVSVNR